MVIAHCDKCRKVMLRRGTVRAQFVGVDDHIDPRQKKLRHSQYGRVRPLKFAKNKKDDRGRPTKKFVYSVLNL